MHPTSPRSFRPIASVAAPSTSGVALVIILAFIVLLTGIVVAFFSRAISERQVSNSSASQTRAELFAQGAADQIIADLKTEIADPANSTVSSPSTGINLYTPKTPANAVPALAGSTGRDGLENLVKRSSQGTASYPGGPSRAAASPTTTASQNGRSVSPARWNKPLFLPTDPAKNTNSRDTNLTPQLTSGAYTAPDWVLVGRDGSNPPAVTPNSTAANYVVGRYAYNIYDEGGLLDANVAGSPMKLEAGNATPVSTIAPYKNALAYADLTQLPGIKVLGSDSDKAKIINALVGWRNYASAGPTTGNFPNYTAFGSAAASSVFTPFDLSMLDNTSGFLRTANTTLASSQSDRMFNSRQQLIQILQSIGSTVNAYTPALQQQTLQYLTTFTRTLEQPSYQPATFTVANAPRVLQDGTQLFGGNNGYAGDQIINPSFLEKRVNGAAFTRSDGVTAKIGEPLVIERFALSKLCWITFRGPSASNLNNPIVTALKAQGVPLRLLEQGTDENIYKYFGLSWDDTNHRWVYDHSSITKPLVTPTSPSSAGIRSLAAISGREPDYFELLKAAIQVGSLGKHGSLPRDQGQSGQLITQGTRVQYRRDILVDMQIYNIGLNIIDQSDPDSYPSRLLVFNPMSSSPASRELAGVENLPYFHRFRNGVVHLQEASTATPPASRNDNSNVALTGAAALLLYPEIWNPHDGTSPVNGVDPANGTAFANMAPTEFQVVANSVDPDHYGSEIPMIMTQSSNPDTRIAETDVPPPILSAASVITDKPVATADRNPALRFQIPSGNTTLFREPTVLMKANVPAGSQLSVVTWPTEVNAFVSNGGLTASTAPGNKFPATAPVGANASCVAGSMTGASPYVGIFMGRAPLQYWRGTSVTTVGSLQGFFSSGAGASLTLRLQYKDAWNAYATYCEVDPPVLDGARVQELCPDGTAKLIVDAFDPRTARLGMMQNRYTNTNCSISATGLSQTNRAQSSFPGQGFANTEFGRGGPGAPDINWSSPNADRLKDSGVLKPSPGWFGDANNNGWRDWPLIPGLLAQNDPSLAPSPNYKTFYADPDGVVRRATGAYMPNANTDVGNPLKTGNNQSRPIILNRPFRTVPELGHVFRDVAWKNLDFFTPESGDTALADVFCINDTDNLNHLTAGKVNLNTRQQPVLKAILGGAFKDELRNLNLAGTLAALNDVEAGNIATALITSTQASPAISLPGLIGQWSTRSMINSSTAGNIDNTGKGYGIDGKASFSGFTKQLTSAAFANSADASWNIQRFHESATRAILANGQTRVWNLMIDLVAQNGRYPSSATTAADLPGFIVEGEQRYWVHLAVDRLTGEVLEKQIEVVKE